MRAIIIERWTILRLGVRAVLAQGGHPVLSAVATASDGIEAVRGARGLDAVIVGQTDDSETVRLVRRVRAASETRILVLADRPDLDQIDSLLSAGATGILGRLAEGIEVLDALERMRRGERVLSNEVIGTLLGGLEGGRNDVVELETSGSGVLTDREAEVLSFLVTGASNRDIAQRLFIGEATVKTHLASTYTKLGVANRRQAVARGLELGLVTLNGSSMTSRPQ